jgi:hypothetical protein
LSLMDELQNERENKLIAHAIEFVETIQPVLWVSARKGYTGQNISLEGREDAHILKNSLFLKNLKILLDGCVVDIQRDEYTDILFKRKYYKSKLVICWI